MGRRPTSRIRTLSKSCRSSSDKHGCYMLHVTSTSTPSPLGHGMYRYVYSVRPLLFPCKPVRSHRPVSVVQTPSPLASVDRSIPSLPVEAPRNKTSLSSRVKNGRRIQEAARRKDVPSCRTTSNLIRNSYELRLTRTLYKSAWLRHGTFKAGYARQHGTRSCRKNKAQPCSPPGLMTFFAPPSRAEATAWPLSTDPACPAPDPRRRCLARHVDC